MNRHFISKKWATAATFCLVLIAGGMMPVAAGEHARHFCRHGIVHTRVHRLGVLGAVHTGVH
jgi:hypothetical protein